MSVVEVILVLLKILGLELFLRLIQTLKINQLTKILRIFLNFEGL